MKRLRSLLLVTTTCLAFLAGPARLAAVEDLGEISLKGSANAGIPVSLRASDPKVLALVQRAFALHGGFIVRPSGGKFELTFNASGSSASVAIGSGGTTLETQTANGANWQLATLRAADLAVQRTLSTPGFFGSTIAFVSKRTGKREIYSGNLTFEGMKQITNDRADSILPNLAPNGRAIVYTGYYKSGFPDVFRIDLGTNQRSTLANFKGLNTGGSYSPNGDRIALILSSQGNPELFVADGSGRNPRRITRSDANEADPTWSPDGRRLAYTSDSFGKPQIFVIDAGGGTGKRIQTNLSRNCSEPAWNPANADQLAFTAAMGGEFEVAVFEFSKGKSRVVTRGAGDAVHPCWLRDGRHIIYTERTRSSNRLMIVDTISGKFARLSPQSMGDSEMATVAYP